MTPKTVKPCNCSSNNLLIIALLSIIFFLSTELIIRIYDLYRSVPPVDILSHLLSGFAIAVTVYWALSSTSVRNKEFITILLTIIIEALSELLEKIEELIIVNPPYLKDVFFWDGVGDLIMAGLGALCALVFLHHIKNSNSRNR